MWMPVEESGRCIYRCKPGSPVPDARAQEIGEYIADLEENSGITPHILLQDATNPESKLHEFFEWDDKKAGYHWRLQQARQIINHFEIVVVNTREEEETRVRAWHSINIRVQPPKGQEFHTETDNGEPEMQRVYVNAIQALSVEDTRKQVVANALRELNGWRHRYQTYDEFNPIFTGIEQLSLAEA